MFCRPTAILGGNVQNGFPYLSDYQSELGGLTFPSDGASVAPYPFYDRWGDTWNVTHGNDHAECGARHGRSWRFWQR